MDAFGHINIAREAEGGPDFLKSSFLAIYIRNIKSFPSSPMFLIG